MNEEKITEAAQRTETETLVYVQVFDDEQGYDEEYYASNLSRKRQFISTQAEKETDSRTESKKRTLFTVIIDFIYHHKVISAVLGVVLAAVAVFGIFKLCQKSYDYNIGIYTCGGEFTDAEIENAEELFRTYGKDRDGDGEVTVKVRTYRLMGESDLKNFINDQILRRDIYGDVKHGSRVNDIIITDETVRDMIYTVFGTLVFDEICNDGVWAEAERSELLGENNSAQEALGFMVFACNYYDSNPQQAKLDNQDAHEVFDSIVENRPEMFKISTDE